ncbi:MAG: hydrogenase nickel incorporation protein HypB [Gemmatimonadales bacterium]|nr:MAG: hydrogenase nickel incorporation protein HypB [Gemmatimonadales bacterium]
MSDGKLINIKEEILAENKGLADKLRDRLRNQEVFLVNLMSSPGSGKTSLILRTLAHLEHSYRMAVIEGDVDSAVDAERVAREGFPAVQIKTGGSCHLSAAMVEKGLEALPLESLDLLFLENIGNLICPAGSDTGANLNVALSSIPEGDDKPLKYLLIFCTSDAFLVNKIDVVDHFDFDLTAFKDRVRRLNPEAPVFEVSCKTGEGIDIWCRWLQARVETAR